jgi:hypothetical protein
VGGGNGGLEKITNLGALWFVCLATIRMAIISEDEMDGEHGLYVEEGKCLDSFVGKHERKWFV